MAIQQISVFIENRTGRLSEILDTLAAGGVDIRALSLADASNFGILRLIVSDPAGAEQLLREKGFPVALSDVLAVEISDRPGGMAAMLSLLSKAKIGVEYAYAFLARKKDEANAVLKVDAANAAIELLQAGGIRILAAEELFGE